MPLLKRKPFNLIPPPAIDCKNKASKNCPVWYHQLTKEIFVDYSLFLERTALYRRPLWQCESTGRSNLTFAEALESEQSEKSKVTNNLPDSLQKAILKRAQFQKPRMDAVVDDLYNFFIRRYVPDDNVECIWDDGILYSAKILHAPPLEDQTSDIVEYKVQLLDENSKGLEEYIKTMNGKDIKRGRLAFSKSLIKRFLRETTTRETYKGAPMIVNNEIAKRFGIDTTLPGDLESAKAMAYSKSRKLRSLTEKLSTPEAPTAQSRLEEARKLEATLKYPMEDLDLPIYRRNPPFANSAVFLDMAPGSGNELKKVPNPTGDLPIRPQSSKESVASDCFGDFLMVWSFLNVFSRPLRLSPFSLNDFEAALRYTYMRQQKSVMVSEVMVALLNCIIRHRLKPGYQPSLLPVRNTTTTFSTNHSLALTSNDTGTQSSSINLNGSNDDDNSDNNVDTTNGESIQQEKQEQDRYGMNGTQQAEHRVHLDRGCTSDEVIKIGKNWDARPIPPGDDHHAWEDIMIGCINDLVIEFDENVADYDSILSTLVPQQHSTLEQREQAFVALGFKEKLVILRLLVNAANETSDIKDYMEECQGQLTELRKQKIEINRERKRIQLERNELEKRYEDEPNAENAADVSESGIESDNDSNSENNIDQLQKKAAHISRHESRQATMKRSLLEQEELEAKRKKSYHQKRQESREKDRELKIRTMALNKLDKEEHQADKKHEQINKDMRKYSTLRFKTLGRDKFYNRYYYLDNIGSGYSHGSGKLFVQSPSVTDLCMLLMNDSHDNDHYKTTPAAILPEVKAATPLTATEVVKGMTEAVETKATKSGDNNSIRSLCGRGGGISFMCHLMEHQGLSDKVHYLKDNIDRMIGTEYLEWWESFDDTQALDELLAWLNPKGVREYLLKRELQKHLPEIAAGVKKHTSERSSSLAEVTRRSTRTTKKSVTPTESWLSYTNKLAK